MTGDSLAPEPAPSGPLYARESAEPPTVGTERGPGVLPGPQTGTESFDGLRDRYAAAIEYALLPVMPRRGHREHAATAVLAVRDEELQQLRDELAALTAISRGYCPHCGRGDCAPTADQWLEQKRRAEQAEDLLRVAHDTSNKSEAERARAVQRAEKAEAADWLAQSVAQSAARDAAGALTRQLEAEAALERVRKLRDAWLGNCLEPGQVRRLLDGLTAALDPKETP